MVDSISISDRFQANYEDYYEQGDSEWRWLGALDKANNIVSLCNALPHGSILEIGAGEGFLQIRPSLASRLFVYHSSLACRARR